MTGLLRMVQGSRNPGLLNDVLRNVVTDVSELTMEHVVILLPAVTELMSSQVDEYVARVTMTRWEGSRRRVGAGL